MTDLEKRADEYADKRAIAYNMPKRSFVIPLLKIAYKTGATQETALLSQHILELQKDKGELIDKVRDLEEKLANADYQLEGRDNEIRELEAHIKEMKGILLCSCEGCSRLPKLYKAFDEEIKENDKRRTETGIL